MKTPESQKLSGVFREYIMGTLARNGLNISDTVIQKNAMFNIAENVILSIVDARLCIILSIK